MRIKENKEKRSNIMFKKRFTSAILVITLLLITGVVFAQGPIGIQTLPGGGWTTGQQIQNVGTGPADIVATAYGRTSGEYPATGVTGGLMGVPSGDSRNILDFHWSGAPTSFEGSAVVSSNERIVAIVNVTNGTAAGQHQGVGSPDTEVGFPLFKNEFGPKSTTFYIQNAGSTPAVMYATFTADSGTKYTWNSTSAIQPNRMVVLNPADASVPTGVKGGLVVTSTVPIAGVVLEHGTTDTTLLQATKGFSPAEYGTTLVAPLIKRQFGNRSTGLQVQNVSNSNVDVYVTYVHGPLSGASGTARQRKLNVAPGASYTFYEALIGESGGDTLPVGTLASATITATGNIAAIVNETFITVPASGQKQTTYHAVAASEATTRVGVPLAKEFHGGTTGKTTGIQVMNVGTANATNVDLAYSFGGTTYTIQNQTIAAGGSETYFKVSASVPASEWAGGNVLPTNQFGGVVITSDQPIVVIVQEADLSGAQDNKNYEGFNLTP
jgi:hypothetical protein